MTTKLKILGCSGGIGGKSQRTTSLLVDHDILIDAGIGVGDLTMTELAAIDHVFITHTHLDHIACLPLMVDTVGDRRNQPLVVHGAKAVLTILRNHIFNWAVWPDFSDIPTAEAPFMRFETIEVGQPVKVAGRTITALPVEHTVPAVGYRIDSGEGSLVFSGDTGVCSNFWRAVNQVENLRYLIVECAFSNREERLARLSKHYCPKLLAKDLLKLQRSCEILITHLKPGHVELAMEEIAECLSNFNPSMLQNNQVIVF